MSGAGMDIITFMKHLKTYRAPLVFNPWRDYEPGLDIGRKHRLSAIITFSVIWNCAGRLIIYLWPKVWATREDIFPAWP